MAIRTHRVTLGTGIVPASALAPRPGVRFWEGVGLTIDGWRDARRYSIVADDLHTHVLFGRNSTISHADYDVVRVVDAALSALDIMIAETTIAARRSPIAADDTPTGAQLRGLRGKERQDWANDVRQTRARAAASERREAETHAAMVLLARLKAERTSIVVEGEDVRRKWASAFELRAARYTRARFGIFGRRPTEAPQVPFFLPARDPHVVRTGATDDAHAV